MSTSTDAHMGDEDDGIRLNCDDQRAARVCALAIMFMNASAPVPSARVRALHYPDLSDDAFRKAFARDRDLLAKCGIALVEVPTPNEPSSWRADEETSFSPGAQLGDMDAMALEIACRPLLSDPSFPLASDLRFALAKIRRAFAEALATSGGGQVGETRQLAALREGLSTGRCVSVAYERADHEVVERTIAPGGFFQVRGVLYLVADTVEPAPGERGPLSALSDPSTIRTYRVERFRTARVMALLAYQVDEGFSLDQWRRLPFQLGDAIGEARLLVADEREDEARRLSLGHGSFSREDGGLVWTVGYSDPAAVASWAVAHGMVPDGPEQVRRVWRQVLEGAVGSGE